MDSVATDTGPASGRTQEGFKGAVLVDTDKARAHVDEVVRSTVEETLNAMLDAEADRVAGAGKYERSADRQDTRAGSYQRKQQTKAGEVTLKVPRLRKLRLETAIIERYERRESSVEEALIEMCLAGVSMRRVEDITEAMWGTRVSASAVSTMRRTCTRFSGRIRIRYGLDGGKEGRVRLLSGTRFGREVTRSP